jgi:hypothetical protein
MKRKLAFACVAVLAALGPLAAATPAYGRGAQLPDSHASCMGWLAEASNPNASGDHIAAIAQSGNAPALAQVRPDGDGFPGLISCVEQIP